MRLVKKPHDAPEALVKCFDAKVASLLKKPDAHSFDARCYRDTCKKELFDLYHGKCAYCERQIAQKDEDGAWDNNATKLTIEHNRPKKGGYYWLGYEWTNLFPTCEDCNSPKGDKFDIRGKRATCPAINDSLDMARCHVCCDELMAEKPMFLHPELDDPTAFFKLNRAGGFKSLPPNEIRANYTYKHTGLGNHTLERKKVLDNYIKIIKGQLLELGREVEKQDSTEVTDRDLRLSFFSIFRRIEREATDERLSFTFVRRQVYKHMDELLFEQVAKINPLYREWIERALLLYVESKA